MRKKSVYLRFLRHFRGLHKTANHPLYITSQKAILSKYAKENHFPNPQFFVDDGYSGTNFNRPSRSELLERIENGEVATLIVKDMSRLAVLNDMVKAVYVHAPDKSKGHREQQIDISYDLVGILPASLLNDLQNGETA